MTSQNKYVKWYNYQLYLKRGESEEVGGHQNNAHKRKRERVWFRFPLDSIIYLIFSFLCSGNRAQHGSVTQFAMPSEFGESAERKCLNGNRVSCTRFLGYFCLLCYIWYTVLRVEWRNSTPCFVLIPE